MGIQLSTNFDLSSQIPLDSRAIVATTGERNALAANNKAYAGLTVYVTGENKYYYYNTGNQWVDFGSSQNLTPTLYLRTSAKDTNGNNAGGIVSAISEDGIKWNSLSRNVTFPAFARDASTIWYDNQWVSVYTNAFTSTGKNFGIATSTNLTSWVTGAPVSLTGSATTGVANNVWAPEWFVDNNEYYVLVRLSTTSGVNYGPPGMGYVKSLNPGTWTSWGPWTPFDNSIRADANDFYIVKKENLYWLFSHGGTHLGGQQPPGLNAIQNITLQYSTHPFSGYSSLVEITEPLRNIIRPGNSSAFFEGPSVVNIQGSHWRLYFQDGLDNSVWSIDSFDDFQSWPTGSLRKNIYEGFNGGGHGTVLKIDEKNFVGITQSLRDINSPQSIGAVALTGNQTISGVKDFARRPSVNNSGILLSGEAYPLNNPSGFINNQDIIFSGIQYDFYKKQNNSTAFNFVNVSFPTQTVTLTGIENKYYLINPETYNRILLLSTSGLKTGSTCIIRNTSTTLGSDVTVRISGIDANNNIFALPSGINTAPRNETLKYYIFNGTGFQTEYVNYHTQTIQSVDGLITALAEKPTAKFVSNLQKGQTLYWTAGSANWLNSFLNGGDVKTWMLLTGKADLKVENSISQRTWDNRIHFYITKPLNNFLIDISDNIPAEQILVPYNYRITNLTSSGWLLQYSGSPTLVESLNINSLQTADFTLTKPPVGGIGPIITNIQYYNLLPNSIVQTTGNQTISGLKDFASRPTVNGTGVLLSGEAAQADLSSTVRTTGDQTISGVKTFAAGVNFANNFPLYIPSRDAESTSLLGSDIADIDDFGTLLFIESGRSGLSSIYRSRYGATSGFGIVFGSYRGSGVSARKGYLTAFGGIRPTGLEYATLVWTDRILSGQWTASSPIRVGNSVSVMTTGNQTISGIKSFNDVLIRKKQIELFSTDLINYGLPLYRDNTLTYNTNFNFAFPTDDPNLQSILYVLRQPSGFGWGVNYNSIIWQNNNPGNPTLDKPRIFLIYRANKTGTTAYGINLTEVASISQTVATNGNQTINGVKNFASRLTVNATGVVLSGEAVQSNGTVTRMIKLTQAQYNALSPVDPTTFYVIVG